jgi:ATP phosphoribosyltransferase
MPLPAYLTETPSTNPTSVLARQVRNLGLEVDLVRTGSTLTIRGLEVFGNESEVNRALRLITNHADANNLSLDAIVYPVQGNIISRYEAAGFLVHVTPSDDGDEDAYTLLRRAARH